MTPPFAHAARRALAVLWLLPLASGCSALFDGSGFLEGSADGSVPPSDAAMDAGPRVDAAREDAGPRPDGATEDAGPLPVDAGGDPDGGVFPAPPAPRRFTAPIELVVRDAEAVSATAVLATGTTPSLSGLSRDAWLARYGTDGTVAWAERISSSSNEQLSTLARRGSAVIAAGITRQFFVGGSTNTDGLFVEAGDSGVGAAWHWGTTADDTFWGMFDGGGVAHWIAVGEWDDGTTKDALVVAFDASMSPVWAARFDAGEEEVFFDGVVIGDTVYLAGQSVRDGNPRALVAAATATGVTWARRGTNPGSTAIDARLDPADGRVVVAGAVAEGRPALLRFLTTGEPSGTLLPETASRATGVFIDGAIRLVTTAPFNGSGFDVELSRLEGASVTRLPFASGVSAEGFLPAPLVVATSPRAVLRGPGGSLLDVPFSYTPEASCVGAAASGTGSPVDPAEMPAITLTLTPLSVSGGPIGSLPTTSLALDVAATACP